MSTNSSSVFTVSSEEFAPIPIPLGRSVIGRASSCDIVIDDPTVSRIHAEFLYTDNQLAIKDAGSKNGTFLNGKRISDSTAIAEDHLALGEVVFALIGESLALSRVSYDSGFSTKNGIEVGELQFNVPISF